MRVVLYLRYSSDKQTDQSIEGQERVCKSYCERMGYEIVGRYVDKATSAFHDSEKRVGFQKMIKDSDKRTFDGIVVYKIDRFSRNRYDSAIYKNKLNKNGVKLISATEAITDTPEGILLESLLEGLAEFYSSELSQKVTRGMNETALKGNSCGGRTPLGYKVLNKKLVEDEKTSHIVKEAFQRYSEGEKIVDIVNDFNAKGYRTSLGKPFTKKSFHSVFGNKVYIGTYKYKDIIIENEVPALVTKELFEKVQEMSQKRAYAPRLGCSKETYMLSGKLYCGHCGAVMTGESGTSATGAKYHYYVCTNYRRGKTCDKKTVSRDIIDDAVFEMVKEQFTEEHIKEYAHAAAEEADRINSNNPDLNIMIETVNEDKKKIAKLIESIENGIGGKTFAKRVVELEEEIDAIEAKIEETKNNMVYVNEEAIYQWLSRFLQGKENSKSFKEAMIKCIVHQVFVYDVPEGYRIDVVTFLDPDCRKTLPLKKVRDSSPFVNHHVRNRTFVVTLDDSFMISTKIIPGRR